MPTLPGTSVHCPIPRFCPCGEWQLLATRKLSLCATLNSVARGDVLLRPSHPSIRIIPYFLFVSIQLLCNPSGIMLQPNRLVCSTLQQSGPTTGEQGYKTQRQRQREVAGSKAGPSGMIRALSSGRVPSGYSIDVHPLAVADAILVATHFSLRFSFSIAAPSWLLLWRWKRQWHHAGRSYDAPARRAVRE
jgi:hypothetical protein